MFLYECDTFKLHLDTSESIWMVMIEAKTTARGNADPCGFCTLFTKSVPHILEKIFFSLDYESFKKCLEVSTAWKELLTSESFIIRGKMVFREEILKDEKSLTDASGTVYERNIFLPKRQNLFQKNVGFPAKSLCFSQNYSVFGVSVSFFSVRNGIKWLKCQNSETENKTVRTLIRKG